MDYLFAFLRYGHETIGEDSAGIRTRRLALGLRFLLKRPFHGGGNLEGQRLPPCYNLLVSNAPAAAKLAGAFLFYLRL